MFAALILCILFSPRVPSQAAPENAKPVELTQTDLFSLADWPHKKISVVGFVLGMTRLQASQLAQTHGLGLKNNLPPKKVRELKGPCVQASCGVYRVSGDWIGLDLHFEATDHISAITVSVPVDAAPEVKRVNLTRQFKGLTREFFNDYSDDLRNRVLGHVVGKTRESAHSAPFAYVEYDYPSLGLIVHATIDTRDNPVKPFDLEVDFMARQ